jgi:hypothetical protein
MSETRQDRRRREEAARQQEAEARQRVRREEAIEKKKALARMMAERRVAYQERRTALLVGPQATARSEDGLRTDGPKDSRPSDEAPDARRYREEVEDRETFEKVRKCLDLVSAPDWHAGRGCTEPLVEMANLLASMHRFASDGSGVKADLVRTSALLRRWDERVPVIPRTERCSESGLNPTDPICKKWDALIRNELLT